MKELKDLNFTDDIIFSAVMRHEDISKAVLEALLGRKIEKVEISEVQKHLDTSIDSHGIRLDVYIKDEQGTVYDVEMQTVKKISLEKRVRYYQSCIDSDLLQRGSDYRNLKDSYVIFIMTEDQFGNGDALYVPEMFINKDLNRPYNDGRHIMFLNADYKNSNASEDIIKLLDYIKCVRNNSPIVDFSCYPKYIKEIDEAVNTEKKDGESRGSTMNLRVRLFDEREAGREEGIVIGKQEGITIGKHEGIIIGKKEGVAEGIEKGKAEMLVSLVNKNILSVKQASTEAGMSEEAFSKMLTV